MTYRRSHGHRQCISVINDLKEEQFSDEIDGDGDDENLDDSAFTKIWRNPKRLTIDADYTLLLSTLSRAIHVANYNQTLLLMKIMQKSTVENQEIREIIEKMFTFLIMQILKEERLKKIDSHIILDWLDTGDRLFCNSGDSMIPKKTYAILKLYFLCRNRKSKLECFSCGCVQKYFIQLYTDNSRLNGALLSLMKPKSLDIHPTVGRLLNSMLEISSIEYFEYYIELLEELQNCSVIDKSDEKATDRRQVQLIGLLCEMQVKDVPKACSKLNSLIGSVRNGVKKKSLAIETALKNTLLTRIFDSITTNDTAKLELSRNSINKMVEIVVNEKYSYAQQSNIFFSPLQLLNRIYLEWDIWKKTWLKIKSQLETLQMSSQQAPIVILYFLSLIYRNDPSLLNEIVDYLVQRYQNADIQLKNTILLLFDIMEKLGDTNPTIHSFFKENRPKSKLLLDFTEELEIGIQYIQNFTNQELNRFLEQKSKKISDEDFGILIQKIKNFEILIDSKAFLTCLFDKLDDENSIIFLENQIKIVINQQDRHVIMTLIASIFKKMKSPIDQKNFLIFLKFPKILLDLTDAQYALLPKNTTNSLISVLILGFAAFFDGNESEITRLFRQFHSKILEKPIDSTKEPLEIIEELCEIIKIKSKVHRNLDISILKPNPDTFITQLKEIHDKNQEKSPQIVERIVQISAILFEKLSLEMRKIDGKILDKSGIYPFCQCLTIIDEYVKKAQKHEIISNFHIFQRVSQRIIHGFIPFDEEWNFLFSWRKIVTILESAKRDREVFEKLMRCCNKNEILLTKLRTKKEFLELEKSIDQ